MKVLLAVDGSFHSDAALETVMNRPWPEGTECFVLSVIEPLPGKIDLLIPQKVIEAQQLLEEELSTLVGESAQRLAEKFGADKVKSEVLEGNPKNTILETARTGSADLIVLGSHGSKGFSDFLLGSVAEAIVSVAPCSVEIIKALNLEALVRKADRKEPLIESRYLVAVDNSEHAPALIDAILARPWPAESKFQVLHVVEPLVHRHTGFLGKTRSKSALMMEEFSGLVMKEHVAKSEELVKENARRLEERYGKGRVTCHVVEGNVRSLILQIAQDWPADLIFVGSHGSQRLTEFLLGSVTTAIVRNAPCSVEVVKIKD